MVPADVQIELFRINWQWRGELVGGDGTRGRGREEIDGCRNSSNRMCLMDFGCSGGIPVQIYGLRRPIFAPSPPLQLAIVARSVYIVLIYHL